jgi:hypothetical protein
MSSDGNMDTTILVNGLGKMNMEGATVSSEGSSDHGKIIRP